MNELRDCIWLDLDGTVADNEHRMPYYHSKEWQTFYELTLDDTPIETVLRVIECLARTYPIFICTARPEHNAPETFAWLQKYAVPYAKVYMRPDKDFRPDLYVKYDMLMRVKKDGYWPLVAFDDRNRIVKMLRDNDVKVMHVQDGDY